MTPLAADLIALIRADGPITLASYMQKCLLDPNHGYYATRDPLGAAGDFTTAPEISQMFGELIGLCLAQCWLDQGAPPRFALAEAGPGRGTLMADILRATRAVPGFHAALSLHLIEASATLRAIQARTLAPTMAGTLAATLMHDDITWHDSVTTLPDLPLYLVANEFFDALPIRQVQRDAAGWREVCVGLAGDDLALGLSAPMTLPQLTHREADTRPGDIVEFSQTATAIAQMIGAHIASHGGAALFIDYGDWRSLGDTFQALRDHAPCNPLDGPGTADLTAHVDFEALATASPCKFSRLTPQGVFLERLGITARAQALAKNLQGDALEAHIAAHRRLTAPAEMGTLFKVLGLYPEGAAPPPGLEP